MLLRDLFCLVSCFDNLKTIKGVLIIVSYNSATDFSRAGSEILQLVGQVQLFTSSHPGRAVTSWHPWEPVNAQTRSGVCTVSMAPAARRFPIPAVKEQSRSFTRSNHRVWVWVCHHRSFSDQIISLNTPLVEDEKQNKTHFSLGVELCFPYTVSHADEIFLRIFKLHVTFGVGYICKILKIQFFQKWWGQ